MIKRYRSLLLFLVLLGAWALFFWRLAAPAPGDRLSYPNGDFTQQFGVFRDIAYRAVIGGRFPVWANCLWAGYPFQADPQAQLFYPPLWLEFGLLRLQGWGNFPIGALVVEVAAHYLLTSLFLFLFLSSLSLRPSAAMIGALVFTYGGYLTGYPPLQTAVLEVSTWLPLALLFAGRLAATRRPRDLALTALTLALAFFAGHPQTFVYVALLTLAYLAFQAYQSRWRRATFLAGTAALVGLTAALAAVQLLPSVQFVLNSTRTSVPFEQAAGGFPFSDVLQFLLTGYVTYWQPLYVGILPLGLAAFTLTRRSPQVRFWAGAALVSLVLSFGTKGAAYDAAYWIVPGFRLFHGPERLALGVSFALAVLAAFGAHHLFGPLARPARRWLARLLRLGTGLLIFTFGLLGLVKYLADFGLDRTAWQRLPDRVGVLTLGVGLALAALALRARVPDLRRWVPAFFVGVVILDLFAADRPVNFVPPTEAYPPNPLVTPILVESGFFRVQDEFQLPGHAGCVYGYHAIEGVTPYRIATYARFLEQAPDDVRLQLLGVRFVVTWRQQFLGTSLAPEEVAAAPSAPGAPNQAGLTKTFRLNGNDPRRAFLIHAVRVEADDQAGYAAMRDGIFDPSSTVILPTAVETNPGRGTDSITVADDVPGHLRLATTSQGAAVLVVSEAYFPGWRATVDGQPVPVLRADGALLAAALPSGVHTIDFTYRPASLVWGAVLSSLALMLAIGLMFIRTTHAG